jgi:hypothetical protein
VSNWILCLGCIAVPLCFIIGVGIGYLWGKDVIFGVRVWRE